MFVTEAFRLLLLIGHVHFLKNLIEQQQNLGKYGSAAVINRTQFELNQLKPVIGKMIIGAVP